ncbi:MAG: ATP-binding protein [Alphaproteobacteria bacterium]
MTASQKIFRERRRYNQWVANETLEDYALRFTAKSARRWSIPWVANTALGTVAFLALEAIGGAITLSYGFTNAVTAILTVGAIIFLTGVPISYYAARYGVDIDLLTRGAGFGYIGSTITSLIYASFTFIFFALEASIMALALEMCFGIPLWLGYLICALVVIPLVTHGITLISQFQFWTQIIWATLQLVPFVFLGIRGFLDPQDWTSFTGLRGPADGSFDLFAFGAACSVIFALIAQTAEQVDFLRFMPEKTKRNSLKWWTAVIAAGPGWVVPGVLKLLIGSFLAVLLFGQGASVEDATDPSHMYLMVFSNGMPWQGLNPDIAIAITGIFVVISQLKINVTNAYAGSLAWSNFFSRLTHHHPGRVVWVVFNVSLALVLMELGIFRALEHTLGLYSNIPVAWLGVITADLMINKPLGFSPRHIEFQRAHLFDFNPVGVGAMSIATVLSIATYLGAFGNQIEGLAPFIALGVALVATPVLAAATKSRFYIARQSPAPVSGQTNQCCICENDFEHEDMAHCPAYDGPICSLCCTLDSRCHDLCKDGASFSNQMSQLAHWALPPRIAGRLNSQIGWYFGLLLTFSGLIAGIFAVVFIQITFDPTVPPDVIGGAFAILYFVLMIVIAIAIWPFVLAQQSGRAARDETKQQTAMLMEEIEAHKQTDLKLQEAKEVAEASSEAKSKYVGGISHELRTPLNAIVGYSQLLESEAAIPERWRPGLRVIRRSGEHISGLIDGLLDISMIEAGRLQIFRDEVRVADFLEPIIETFRLQAQEKGIGFDVEVSDAVPTAVYTDEKRLRQILLNLLTNAVRATAAGQVSLRIGYRSQVATFEIKDTGTGIAPEDLERIFRPFEQINADGLAAKPGAGLGLTITKLMTEAMGGSIEVDSKLGQGTQFTVKLLLSFVPEPRAEAAPLRKITGYTGPRRVILVTDDDPAHMALMRDIFEPFGFTFLGAPNGRSCIDLLRKHKPDLLLLDISLPDMRGWQVVKILREEDRSEIPIVIISADPRKVAQQDELSQVQSAYFLKPVDVPKLLETTRKILGLTWTYAAETDETITTPKFPTRLSAEQIPAPLHLTALRQLSGIGDVKGVLRQLDQILAEQPETDAVIRYLRERMYEIEFGDFDAALTTLERFNV